ncbi:molybdopterin adenylyltransferase [Campylobacter sp. JMF_02 ED1]|uniref:molybdopterin adenylyltransferase n=1 Tax=unclassified Campylobacter TaxID=2593542 RepID=UPI0022E9A2F2|nr:MULTISPECIES: molybdopterin adenylyltransferase [unclassified Campylobacter]MDA3049442.1 molybdopterin adenylyltransferase [Campylobacter sp. JMF_15 NE4]MDA3051130.1 molybdopterin adenylyltransferase [Campylobacter sp. JMF_02 ED1]
MQKKVKIGILTISDRASSGVYEDLGGPEIKRIMSEWIEGEVEFDYRIIADERALIEKSLREMCGNGCDAVFTTGGTGPAPRDVTPEATEAVCEKMLPGFGELMRAVSLKYVPTAILSRQTAGIYKNSLIVNLPGNPKAILQCLEPIFPAIPYCIDLIGGAYIEVSDKITAFRPKKK